MCAKSAGEVPAEIIRRLRSARDVLLVTHARPDGDALGCLAGLAIAARGAGRTVHLLVPDKIPKQYEFLFEPVKGGKVSSVGRSPRTCPSPCPPAAGRQAAGRQGAFPGLQDVARKDRFADLAESADAIVILDTCAIAQLDGLEKAIPRYRRKTVVIDHHVTPDRIGAVRWIDPTAAAAGVMVLEMLETLGWPVAPAAQALGAAIITDTGWLRFANTDARCLRAMARLLEAGVKSDKLYARLYQSDRPERLRLMERMLRSLEFHCSDRLAVMTLRKADFARTGALQEETENLLNEAFRVGSVEAVILLTEMPDCTRASLRSRECVDVAAVAQRFGGGGHPRAAGLRSKEALPSVRERLVSALKDELKKLSPKSDE